MKKLQKLLLFLKPATFTRFYIEWNEKITIGRVSSYDNHLELRWILDKNHREYPLLF
jgi:hypothetical protein